MKYVSLIILALFLTACGGSTTNSVSEPSAASASPQASVQSTPQSEFEKDLAFIKKGGFTYVWLISRKDGKPLEPTDSIYLRANAPQVVDWIRTDEGKKVFAGTNFNLEEGNLVLLRNRYIFEDYSSK